MKNCINVPEAGLVMLTEVSKRQHLLLKNMKNISSLISVVVSLFIWVGCSGKDDGSTLQSLRKSKSPTARQGSTAASGKSGTVVQLDPCVPVLIQKQTGMRTEFLSDNWMEPIQHEYGQEFEYPIRVKIYVSPGYSKLNYQYEVHTRPGVGYDDEGRATGKMRLRANLGKEDFSSRSISDKSFPLAREWLIVSGSFSLSEEVVYIFYVEPYGVTGFPAFRNLQLSVIK